jgi:hypothetical protein
MTIMQARKDRQDAAFFREVERNRRGFIIASPKLIREEEAQSSSIKSTEEVLVKDKLSLDR